MGVFPFLEWIGYFDAESQVAVVEAAIMNHASSIEKASRIRAWEEHLKPSLDRQSAWMKRKADAHLRLHSVSHDQPPSSVDLLTRLAVHPVNEIKQAEAVWLPQWTAAAPEVLMLHG